MKGGIFMEGVYKELGKKIRKYRKNKGLTTLELAERLNVSVGHISNIENGKNDIFKLELLFNLTKELDIPLNNLLNISELKISKVTMDAERIEVSFIKPDIVQNRDMAVIEKYLKILIEKYLENIFNYNYNEESVETITNHLVEELSFINKLNQYKKVSPFS